MNYSFALAYFVSGMSVKQRVLSQNDLGPIENVPLDITSFSAEDYQLDYTTIMLFEVSETITDKSYTPFGLFSTKQLYSDASAIGAITAQAFVEHELENVPRKRDVLYRTILRHYGEFKNVAAVSSEERV